MTIIEAFLPEFKFEMSATRPTLERCEERCFQWRPHPKSMPFMALAAHLAEIPAWVVNTVRDDSLDLAPKDGAKYQAPKVATTAELLQLFDKNVERAMSALEGLKDETLLKNWSLLAGGNEIFTMPKIAVLRGFVMKHMIHHRAQLGVYLRLNDIAVPSIYGPSADENRFS